MARQLNQTQQTTLKIIVKFRYVTTDNLAAYRQISSNAAYSSLEILRKTGLIGKLYDTTYRLQNKSARYYLTQNGIAYVRKELLPQLTSSLWAIRKNDAAKSMNFIDEQVAIHSACNQLRSKYGDKSRILTATELYGVNGIMKPLPGLLVELVSGKSFFVEVTDGQHLFMVKKRIRKYIKNYEDNEWDWEVYPDVYIVRLKAPDRTRLRKYVEEQMENAYLDGDDFNIKVVNEAMSITT